MKKFVQIFPWNDVFDTGLPEIDAQHKRLVELLNKLANHLAYKVKTPTIDEAFDELAQYALYHFDTEEAVWQQYFADDEWNQDHLVSHTSFMADVIKIKANMQTASYDETMDEVVAFLTNWLAFHILEADKRMAIAVSALTQGSSMSEAKQMANANAEINGAIKTTIKSVLNVYAKNEFVKKQIIRYLTITQEDGGMCISGLQRLAKSVGVDNPEKIHFQIELIRAIQRVTDDDPCFQSKNVSVCHEQECIWRAECKKIVAKWLLR